MTDLKYRSLVNRVIECFEWAEPATEGDELFPYGSAVRRDLEVRIDEILSGSFDKEVQETADRIAHDTFEAQKLNFKRSVARAAIEMFEPSATMSLRTVGDFVRYGKECLQSLEALRDEMEGLSDSSDEDGGTGPPEARSEKG